MLVNRPIAMMLPAYSAEKTRPIAAILQRAAGDERFKRLDARIKNHQHQADSLMEVLREAQELFGYLDMDVMAFISHSLKLPPGQVYGVASFNSFFKFKPPGCHICTVCTGTSCFLKGADRVLAAIEDFAGVKPGETTVDGELSLVTARCLGACAIAPAVVFDHEVAPRQSPESTVEHLREWIPNGSGIEIEMTPRPGMSFAQLRSRAA